MRQEQLRRGFLSLKQHPMLREKEKMRIQYVQLLEYFQRRYSKNDSFAEAAFFNYKNALLTHWDRYIYEDIREVVTSGAKTRRTKRLRFFSYRFALLVDCLFINAFDNREKALRILKEIEILYDKKYRKKIEELFEALYEEHEIDLQENQLRQTKYAVDCWKRTRAYEQMQSRSILVTANMSAGKSTLLNAIIGKKVNKTQNDACTAKLHYILSKPYEDGYSYKLDYELCLDANEETLLADNEKNTNAVISVGTYFRSFYRQKLCLIDTPGVNSSLDEEHRSITRDAIAGGEYDKLLYVLNGENMGTFDETKHLQYVRETSQKPILFIVNKVDRYRVKEDSIENTLKSLKTDLIAIGFTNPIICPVSAYAGYLAKKKLYHMELNEEEEDELTLYMRKFRKDDYKLSVFYDRGLSNLDLHCMNENNRPYMELLVECGIYCLEKLIYA